MLRKLLLSYKYFSIENLFYPRLSSIRAFCVYLVLFILGLLVLPINVTAQKDFSSYKKENNQSSDKYIQEHKENFNTYCQEIRRAFSEYRAKAAAIWGEEKAFVPSREQWVSYRNSMQQRYRVDFQKGEAYYEIALDSNKENISKKVKSRLEDAIVASITQGPDKRSIQEIAENPGDVDPKKASFLSELFTFKEGKLVTSKNAREFAEKKVHNKVETSKVEGEDGKERVVASVNISMIPDHLKKRAKRYEDIVKKQAKQRSLEPELVFAIIETESYFNPQARSPIPAFGLMQLVPVTGGKEAYRIVYGESKRPSQKLLYQPKENVKLGSAYFHRLYFTYMQGVEDEKSRLWCAIASYNTGPYNLFDTFSEKNKSEAIRKINTMHSDEVYNYLTNNLPYKETRDYIKKVRKRMPKYQQI